MFTKAFEKVAKKKIKVQYMTPLRHATMDHYQTGKLYDHNNSKFIKNLMGVK